MQGIKSSCHRELHELCQENGSLGALCGAHNEGRKSRPSLLCGCHGALVHQRSLRVAWSIQRFRSEAPHRYSSTLNLPVVEPVFNSAWSQSGSWCLFYPFCCMHAHMSSRAELGGCSWVDLPVHACDCVLGMRRHHLSLVRQAPLLALGFQCWVNNVHCTLYITLSHLTMSRQ